MIRDLHYIRPSGMNQQQGLELKKVVYCALLFVLACFLVLQAILNTICQPSKLCLDRKYVVIHCK